MSNGMFSAEGISDEELIQKIMKMRNMLSSQSCHNHIGLHDSVGMNLAILEEEYEARQQRHRLEAQEKRAKKSDKPVTTTHINLGEIAPSGNPYDGL